MRQLARVANLFGCACVAIVSLTDCSTPLLNLHTLDLAATIDDVAVRQVVFNLAKVAENAHALPSQVQIPSGQVSVRTSVTPTATVPLNNVFTSTSQVASQVVAASGALTTTTTNIGANQRVDSTTGVSGVMEDVENWNVSPVQDPEQLRRLQLLYQYGTGQITALWLLCWYPVPELEEKAAEKKSDLQTLADAIKLAQEKRDPAVSDNNGQNVDEPGARRSATKDTGGKAAPKDPAAKDPAAKVSDDKKPRLYIRGEFAGSCNNIAKRPVTAAKWMFVGPNPDTAFLKPPGCILCAFPNKAFKNAIRTSERIFPDRYSDITAGADVDKYLYVPVVLNDLLIPVNPDWTPCAEKDFYKCRQGKIDWLRVVPNGTEPPPSENWRRVGSSHGYTVYTNDEQRFSEFVLAVIEATLQPHEIEKQGATAPPVVQTNPR